MSDTIITVEKLSKRYLVGHNAGQHAGYATYATLRDLIGREARNMGRRAVDLLRGRQIIDGDEVDQFWALKDVSFELKRGQVLGIVGRNGAGKSTLLKIMSRITEPTLGRAILRGRVASLLEVGTGFHPELTGRENVYLNGAILGMKREEIRRKFDEIVAFADVERFLDTPVKRYSSGMYMRLAFSVAAHLEPEILVVDEVLAVGDAEFQKKSLGKLHDVASKQGRTVLFVSHNMAAVENMCDCAMLLEQGRSIAQGDTTRIVQSYLREMTRVATIPLEQRVDREGSGEIRFISMVPERTGHSPVSAFRCGDEAILHFVLENRTGRKLQKLRVAFKIFNEAGYCVGQLDSWLLGQDVWEVFPGRTSVRIVIPRMTLTPGRYRISTWAALNGSVADWILEAALFDVEEGDYYGTGRLPTTGRVAFLVDHQIMTGATH